MFGEVKQIRKPLSTHVPSPKPLGIMDQSMTTKNTEANLDQHAASTTTIQMKTLVVITENVSATKPFQMKECNVCIERLPTTTSTSAVATKLVIQHAYQTPKAETPHRTSDRPHAIVAYSKFMSGNDDDTSPAPLRGVQWI